MVSLSVTGTRNFESERAGSAVGTGFIVDAERGIVLTNRHMVHTGPVRARATLFNDEEIDLQPVYRDPVHDFGFYRFDPRAIQHMEVRELALSPDSLSVGMEVRVVGNDAGEQLAILDGTIAKVDRSAPFYGRGRYNDFNTFYVQASSNTSGGSSGSPVIDVDGRVVALNAGGKMDAASSYYLPLERVVRALDAIREEEPVSRGTIQTTFTYAPFDELRRLGLSKGQEAEIRAASPLAKGRLVVGDLVPGSPASRELVLGDVVWQVEGRQIDDFIELEEILDTHVGQTVELEVVRLGEHKSMTLPIEDLHALTPSSYLEVSGGILTDVSYQQARSLGIERSGVYVASAGFMLKRAGVPAGSILHEVAGQPVATLEDFEQAIAQVKDRQAFSVRFTLSYDPSHFYERVLKMDRTWFETRRCQREDRAGTWPCQTIEGPDGAAVSQSPAAPWKAEGRLADKFGRALVDVTFEVPYPTAGVAGHAFAGTGVVVDPDQGLVLVSRAVVPVALGEVSLRFNGDIEVEGVVSYLHPIHNLAIISYDPALLPQNWIPRLKWREEAVSEDRQLTMLHLGGDGEVNEQPAQLSAVDWGVISISGQTSFREMNTEAIRLRADPSVDDALVFDPRSKSVVGYYTRFRRPRRGDHDQWMVPTRDILRALEQATASDPVFPWLGVELKPLSAEDARVRGVTPAELKRMESELDTPVRSIYEVIRVAGGAPASDVLRQTDLLLRIDGQPFQKFVQAENLTEGKVVTVEILRGGKHMSLSLEPTLSSAKGIRHLTLWGGMVVHAPHQELFIQRGFNGVGVFISHVEPGTPAGQFGVPAQRLLLAVNGEKVTDMATFERIIAKIAPSEPVVLMLQDLEGRASVRTVELDLQFWPTETITLKDGEWTRTRPMP